MYTSPLPSSVHACLGRDPSKPWPASTCEPGACACAQTAGAQAMMDSHLCSLGGHARLEQCTRSRPTCPGLGLHEAVADLGRDVVNGACTRGSASPWTSRSRACGTAQQGGAPGVCGRNTDDARDDTPMSLSMSKYCVIIIICMPGPAISLGAEEQGLLGSRAGVCRPASSTSVHAAHLDDIPAADVRDVTCAHRPACQALTRGGQPVESEQHKQSMPTL